MRATSKNMKTTEPRSQTKILKKRSKIKFKWPLNMQRSKKLIKLSLMKNLRSWQYLKIYQMIILIVSEKSLSWMICIILKMSNKLVIRQVKKS